MNRNPILLIQRIAFFLGTLLILKIVVVVFWSYRDYFPPHFRDDFLIGRDHYFWNGYHWGFYVHIVSGPISLLLGVVLISDWFRKRFPRWHRRLGRIQVANVLLLVVPSGLWMSLWAANGWPTGLAFAALALATGFCAAMGWRKAVLRQFASHRRWMWRLFVLLGSAVAIRVLGGITVTFEWHYDWIYTFNSWLSWIGPLVVCELLLRLEQPGEGLRYGFFRR